MKQKQLSETFLPASYEIKALNSKEFAVFIKGRRVGRPSKRLTFHQSGLKIKNARIVQHNRSKIIEYKIDRINHLPSFQEVRLHTEQLQYPGEYDLELVFSGDPIDKDLLRNELNTVELRNHFPSIDEHPAKENITISFA